MSGLSSLSNIFSREFLGRISCRGEWNATDDWRDILTWCRIAGMPRLLPDSARIPRRIAFVIALAAPLAAISLHLLPALLSGLLIHALVRTLAPRLERHLSTHGARVTVVALLAAAVVAAVAALVVAMLAFFHGDVGSLSALMHKMAEVVESSRSWLPDWIDAYLPADRIELQSAAANWLRQHAGEIELFGKESARGLVHALLGMVIGALLALRETDRQAAPGPLVADLAGHATSFDRAFRQIVFAQVQIAAINAAITGLYLVVVLPGFGIHLPLAKTMVALTFVTGLLPIAGNLVSNLVIVVLSLAHSPALALVSLAFLVIIHKLEYFLNARIVGRRIKARAWELLAAMLVMEAAFGLPGLILAPIYYAFLKTEIERREWL